MSSTKARFRFRERNTDSQQSIVEVCRERRELIAASGMRRRFWHVHSMEIDDVEWMIDAKETVVSPFVCRRDPLSNTFDLTLDFGNIEEGWLSVHVGAHVQREFLLNPIETILRSSSGEVLRELTDNSSLNHISDVTMTGYDKFYQFTASDQGSWRISIEIEYEQTRRSKLCKCDESPDRLQQDYLSLLENPRNADITFCFPNRQIAAHKVILSARAPYFANMFESGMREVASNEIHIKDVDSGVFTAVLRFIYAGAASVDLEDHTLELLVAADKYGLDELKDLCETRVRDRLDIDNVVDALVVADGVNCPNLRERAIIVLRENFIYLDEESSKKLMDHPKLLFEAAAVFSRI